MHECRLERSEHAVGSVQDRRLAVSARREQDNVDVVSDTTDNGVYLALATDELMALDGSAVVKGVGRHRPYYTICVIQQG